MARQPDFIIFMTDQQRADHLGCYGNAIVQTPNIDALAERGVRFEQFYVSTPICQPNRACLMTGQMSTVNGCRQNGIGISLQSLTYADILRSAGYQTGLVGKAHFQNVSPIKAPPREQQGEGKELSTSHAHVVQNQRMGKDYLWEVKSEWAKNPDRSLPLPYYGFDHVRLCIGHGDQVEGHYSAWLRDKLDGAADPRGPANAIKAKGDNLAQIWKTSVPEELYPTSYIKQEAIEFLDQHAESEAPLLLVVSFPDPHHPFTPPGKYSEMYDPKDIPLPKTFDHSIDQRNDVPEGIRQSYEKGAENPNAYWPFHPDAEHLKQMIALNYGSITMIDDAIGKILDHYARLRPEQENVVCFMSDHGDYMGDHGAILKQGLHYNGITQVPFIWMDSEADKPDVSPLQASAIDFAPTLLQRAGLRIPIGMQGDDLFAQNAENKPILIEDPGIGVSFHGDARTAVLSLIHEGWRISIFERSDLGELYNRIEDPDELNNLWASMEPAILQKKTEMLFHLSQRQLELRDLSLTASNQA